jgi:hypothetical protein
VDIRPYWEPEWIVFFDEPQRQRYATVLLPKS